jgi:signal transduction histidine kinase
MLKGLVERWLAMRFALPVVLLSAAVFLVFAEVSYSRATDAVRSAVQVSESRVVLQRVMRLLSDAETGQRGYLIAGREEFLEPYYAAAAEMPLTLQRAQALMAGQGPQEAAAMHELQRLIAQRLSEMDTTLRLRQDGDPRNAETMVGAGIGKEQMDAVRALVETQLARSDQKADAARASIFGTLLHNRLGLGTLVVLSALGLVMFIQQGRQLEEQRDQQRLWLLGERERLEQQVADRTRELRELARHLMAVREDERAHLARELHDELGALLTAAKLDVARLRSSLKAQAVSEGRAGAGAMDERLNHLTQALNDGIALKRRIIEDLRPSSLDNLGLREALDILCREMAARLGLRVDAALEDVAPEPPADLAVYRFVQEALTNAGKYARARSVRVSLARAGDALVVQVSDDGVGFDTGASLVGHHGLSGMRFRVESLGGTMSVDSAAGRGTLLRAVLPARAAPPAAAAPDPAAAAPAAPLAALG